MLLPLGSSHGIQFYAINTCGSEYNYSGNVNFRLLQRKGKGFLLYVYRFTAFISLSTPNVNVISVTWISQIGCRPSDTLKPVMGSVFRMHRFRASICNFSAVLPHARTLALISLLYALSIGLTFFNKRYITVSVGIADKLDF